MYDKLKFGGQCPLIMCTNITCIVTRLFLPGNVYAVKLKFDLLSYRQCCHPEHSVSGVEGSTHFVSYQHKFSAKILRLAPLAQDDNTLHTSHCCKSNYNLARSNVTGQKTSGKDESSPGVHCQRRPAAKLQFVFLLKADSLNSFISNNHYSGYSIRKVEIPVQWQPV